MRQVDRVAGAGVVDVVALLVRHQAVVAGVVDALERQRRPEFVALCGMVVDDVEDDLDAMGVKLVHHLLEFVHHRRLQIARLGREEGERIIAPIIPQSLVDEIAVVDKGVDRQQFGAGDAERAQIGRDVRIGQAGKGAAVGFRNQRMKFGKALDVHLVEDRALPGDLRLARGAPGKGRDRSPGTSASGGALSRSSNDLSLSA